MAVGVGWSESVGALAGLLGQQQAEQKYREYLSQQEQVHATESLTWSGGTTTGTTLTVSADDLTSYGWVDPTTDERWHVNKLPLPSSILGRLRHEIDSWHGNILER
jgi:hypothetical protein